MPHQLYAPGAYALGAVTHVLYAMQAQLARGTELIAESKCTLWALCCWHFNRTGNQLTNNDAAIFDSVTLLRCSVQGCETRASHWYNRLMLTKVLSNLRIDQHSLLCSPGLVSGAPRRFADVLLCRS